MSEKPPVPHYDPLKKDDFDERMWEAREVKPGDGLAAKASFHDPTTSLHEKPGKTVR